MGWGWFLSGATQCNSRVHESMFFELSTRCVHCTPGENDRPSEQTNHLSCYHSTLSCYHSLILLSFYTMIFYWHYQINFYWFYLKQLRNTFLCSEPNWCCFFLHSKWNRSISVICWVAGFAGICLAIGPLSVCLAGISLIQLSGLFIRSCVNLSVCSFAAFVHSFCGLSFSHWLCIPQLLQPWASLHVTVYLLTHKIIINLIIESEDGDRNICVDENNNTPGVPCLFPLQLNVDSYTVSIRGDCLDVLTTLCI